MPSGGAVCCGREFNLQLDLCEGQLSAIVVITSECLHGLVRTRACPATTGREQK